MSNIKNRSRIESELKEMYDKIATCDCDNEEAHPVFVQKADIEKFLKYYREHREAYEDSDGVFFEGITL